MERHKKSPTNRLIDIVESKQTYKNAANAMKACALQEKEFHSCRELPSGRWAFSFKLYGEVIK